MGLIIPQGPSWGQCTDNLPATPADTAFGTNVVAGANNADGTAVSLIAAITHDVEMLVILATGYQASTVNSSTLLDILIDPAGGTTWNTDPLIPDLMIGFTGAIDLDAIAYGNPPTTYYFPIWIPAGASIGARARTAHSANLSNGRVVVYAMGGNSNPASWWCGQTVTAIGITAASSRGEMHTPGASGAFSTWTNFGSTLPLDTGAIQWGVQGEADISNVTKVYHFEFGVGSTRVGPRICKSIESSEIGRLLINPGPVFHKFSAGTQLMVRGTTNTTGPVPIDVAAYAVS